MITCVAYLVAAAMHCTGLAPIPIVVGANTPVGTFVAAPLSRDAHGFDHQPDGIAAIHVALKGREKLFTRQPQFRRNVSAGCINVVESDYRKLPRRSFKLEVRK